MSRVPSPQINGFVADGFARVRDAFAANFAHRRELGGACCAYRHGAPVVDIWGGVRDKQTGRPWERDTMVIIHSATKGLAAMTLAIAHSRGWLDRLAVILARQKPAWEPGTRQAYHAITLGFYEGELLRRIDPQHRSLGHFFQDEIGLVWTRISTSRTASRTRASRRWRRRDGSRCCWASRFA